MASGSTARQCRDQPFHLQRPGGTVVQVVAPGQALVEALEMARQADVPQVAPAQHDTRARGTASRSLPAIRHCPASCRSPAARRRRMPCSRSRCARPLAAPRPGPKSRPGDVAPSASRSLPIRPMSRRSPAPNTSRVTGRDLLRERGPGTGHADDEHGQLGGVAPIPRCREGSPAYSRQSGDPPAGRTTSRSKPFRYGIVVAGQEVGGGDAAERRIVVARLVEQRAQRISSGNALAWWAAPGRRPPRAAGPVPPRPRSARRRPPCHAGRRRSRDRAPGRGDSWRWPPRSGRAQRGRQQKPARSRCGRAPAPRYGGRPPPHPAASWARFSVAAWAAWARADRSVSGRSRVHGSAARRRSARSR